jgi:hypothetical protein
LDEDDRKEEEAMIGALASADPLTPEDREATAQPSDAGDYWTEWNPFRVAQRLFADEVAQVDGDAQDKLNKKMLGARTVVIRKWFNDLPKSKLEEVEKVAASWNKLGCTDKEKRNV